MTRREKEITEAAVRVLNQYLQPHRIILFGSRAKGKSQKGSDFDFAVDQSRPDIDIERRIRDGLEDALGLHDFDIVYLEDADEDFKNIVLKTGKVIYERRT